MSAFEYQAVNARGKAIKGVIEAESLRQARQCLSEQQLTPIHIVLTAQRKQTRSFKHTLRTLRQRLNIRQLVGITRQLSTLIKAAIPLDEALSAVAETQTKTFVRAMILTVRAKVLQGLSLSQALHAYPHAFPAIYRTSVAAGEKAGRLDTVLGELANYTQKQQTLKQQIQQALLYPCIMVVVSISVVIYLLSSVVPKILQVVQDAHQTLPWQTTALLSISHTVTQDGLWIILVLLAMMVGIRALFKQPKIKYRYHQCLLKLPLVKSLLLSINVTRFARTLAITSSASVPLLDGLNAAKSAVTLLPLQAKLTQVINEVREGAALHIAFRRSKIFPPTFTYLIASGEATGQLNQTLTQAADDEQTHLENTIKSLLTLFEPMMILIMGGIVLFIVLAILVPIFNLDQIAGG